MSKKPGYFLLFKIVGIVGAVATVGGIILAILGFGDFESNNFMIGTFVSVGGVTLAAIGIATGFAPEIAKARAKTIRYIQEENKDDLSAIASNNAEIMSDAITTTASAVADGMKKTMFCKHCGAAIDADSKFCSACGKEL
jgi:membrane protease subunit (stomatin/prohibitin family)